MRTELSWVMTSLFSPERLHSKKILGCFNPNLGKIWTNPNVMLKM